MTIDIDSIEAKWLVQCGSCDAGLPMGCSCPDGDHRSVIQALTGEIRRLREEREQVRQLTRRLSSVLVAVSPLLETPYTDAPEWTPWTRYVGPAIKRLREALGFDKPPSDAVTPHPITPDTGEATR